MKGADRPGAGRMAETKTGGWVHVAGHLQHLHRTDVARPQLRQHHSLRMFQDQQEGGGVPVGLQMPCSGAGAPHTDRSQDMLGPVDGGQRREVQVQQLPLGAPAAPQDQPVPLPYDRKSEGVQPKEKRMGLGRCHERRARGRVCVRRCGAAFQMYPEGLGCIVLLGGIHCGCIWETLCYIFGAVQCDNLTHVNTDTNQHQQR